MDKKAGDGIAAKKGKTLSMRYILRLGNGKIVDQNKSGKPVRSPFCLTCVPTNT